MNITILSLLDQAYQSITFTLNCISGIIKDKTVYGCLDDLISIFNPKLFYLIYIVVARRKKEIYIIYLKVF
jgi:hypothetical protein